MEGRTRGDSRIRPKLLLVDDVPANLLAYRAILGKLGLDLHEAASGHEALSLVLRHEFAAILMDVQMPDLDGYETAELIRHLSEVASTNRQLTVENRRQADENDELYRELERVHAEPRCSLRGTLASSQRRRRRRA